MVCDTWKKVPPITFESLQPSSHNITKTVSDSACRIVQSCDLLGLRTIDRADVIELTCLVHRKSYSQSWVLCKVLLPKQDFWYKGDRQCAWNARSDEAQPCCHSLSLLLIAHGLVCFRKAIADLNGLDREASPHSLQVTLCMTLLIW